MSERPTSEATPAPTADEQTAAVRLAVRLAAVMLEVGSGTDDIEIAISRVCSAFGTANVDYAVTFSNISVSVDDPQARRPTTFVRTVRERKNDFSRLAKAAALVERITDGDVTLAQAEAGVSEVERRSWPYSRAIEYLAPPLSATGSTLVFGGSALDAFATLAIALVVQPVLARLDASSLPPFFRSVMGAALSTLIVGLLVGLNLPIEGGLVLTGSLLGLLPGYALVSGFRDLIDQSIMSGTARLAEALLLGAGVAGGTALGISVAELFDVRLSLLTVGRADWSSIISVLAAVLAVGAFAVRLGVPWRYVWQSALLGALSWILFISIAGGSLTIESSLATFASALLVGVLGRLIARYHSAPSALWVVPAILPLLPGLQIVTSLLAPTNTERIAGMAQAATTAFTLGVGVGMGDIIVATIFNVRDKVIGPVERVVGRGIRPTDEETS